MKRIHFNSIASTHQYAKKFTHCAPSDFIFITADYQTSGIGSRKQTWHAKKNSSLLLSTIFYSPPSPHLPYLSQIAALSMIHTLQNFDITPHFKFPNDILIDQQKVCGILSEIYGQYTISSLGLNLTQTKNDLTIIDQPATSLLIETKKIFTANQILATYSNIFISNLKRFLPKDWQNLYSLMDLPF